MHPDGCVNDISTNLVQVLVHRLFSVKLSVSASLWFSS